MSYAVASSLSYENPILVTRPEQTSLLCGVDDKRSDWQRITDVVMCIWATLKMVFVYIGNFFFYFSNRQNFEVEPIKKNDLWMYDVSWNTSDSSEGLYVFVPGLNAPTIAWSPLIKDISQKYPAAHCLLPNLLEEGNTSIEEVGRPLVALINDYLKEHPGTPIHLFGTSRGGQLVAYIEKELSCENMKQRDLFVVVIAGVIHGTQQIDWLKDHGLLFLSVLKDETVNELMWGNPTATQLIGAWQQKQHDWAAHNVAAKHLVISTVNDEMVTPCTSSLPNLSGDVTYKVFRGETHVSIVSNSQDEVLNWLADQKSKKV